ncbi:hypothetical protein AB0I28_30180 [Phytomonospora sp. NPDC050363]|uniref:hypothetical protein n=1 Tax=Phytomonospora sp. NPDC050363 TaxID=3155642 RepID=UPI0033DE9DA8
MQPPPYAHPYDPRGFAPAPPQRPAQLVIAATLVAMCGAVVFGLTGAVLWHAVNYEWELLAELPLLVLIPGLVWMGYLVPALLRGRRWSRMATAVTVPIQIPFYVLFALIMGSMLTDSGRAGSPKTTMRETVLVLCLVGIPVAAVAPLFLIGNNVRAYVQRPQ